MKRLLACAALLTLGAVPAGAQDASDLPPQTRTNAAPLTPEQATQRAKSEAGGAQVVAFMKGARERMKAARFSGEVGIAFAYRHYPHRQRADEFFPNSVLMAQDAQGNVRKAGEPWRWASVTKQVIAVLVMQEAARGTINLDQPVARYLPALASPNAQRITVRQLLRHQTGLPNPDDTPANAEGVARLSRNGLHEIILSAPEPEAEELAAIMIAFEDVGYKDLALLSVKTAPARRARDAA